MDLKQLPKALQEMKDKLLASVKDNAAPVANKELVAALTRRASAKDPGSKQNNAGIKKLNAQQQKFLKQASEEEQSEPVAIAISKQDEKYVITVTGNKGQLAVTAADIASYKKTISEQIKKSSEDIL